MEKEWDSFEEFILEYDDSLDERKDTMLLKCEFNVRYNINNCKFSGIMYSKNSSDPIVKLFEHLLEKPKYRKVFLEKSFRAIIIQKQKGDI